MKKVILLTLAATVFAQTLGAIDLPSAPSGFVWQQVPELKAAFLRPDGWFFNEESAKGTSAYFITKEDIKQTGRFDTGLTINVFHLKKDSAVDRGKLLINQMTLGKHAQEWTQTTGPFQEAGCEINDTDSTGTIVMHALTIANPKTNTLYLVIFESPQSDWESAWKLGKPIMDSLAIDDGV